MDGEAKALLTALFSKDNILILGTFGGDYPAIRHVDGYYEDGAFYTITHALSNKMRQIEKCPKVSLCGDWFSARGRGENLGYVLSEENKALTEKLRQVFSLWIDNGDTNFEDENTVILKIVLESAVLISNGKRFEINF